jgi:hypothetical protein
VECRSSGSERGVYKLSFVPSEHITIARDNNNVVSKGSTYGVLVSQWMMTGFVDFLLCVQVGFQSGSRWEYSSTG